MSGKKHRCPLPGPFAPIISLVGVLKTSLLQNPATGACTQTAISDERAHLRKLGPSNHQLFAPIIRYPCGRAGPARGGPPRCKITLSPARMAARARCTHPATPRSPPLGAIVLPQHHVGSSGVGAAVCERPGLHRRAERPQEAGCGAHAARSRPQPAPHCPGDLS